MSKVKQDDADAFYASVPEPGPDGFVPAEATFSKFASKRDAYYADHDRVSSSSLRQFADDPTVYYHEHVLRDRVNESTPAMDFGNYFHTMLLRPTSIGEDYIHIRDTKEGKKPPENTNEGKLLMKKIREAAAGRKIMFDNDHNAAESMAGALMSQQQSWNLLKRPHLSEVAFQWKETVKLSNGSTRIVPMKLMLDRLCFLRPRTVFIYDVKTAHDPEPYSIWYSIRDNKYDWQAAIYQRACEVMGLTVSGFAFAVVGSKWPHHAAMYGLDNGRLGQARVAYAAKLGELADIQQTAADAKMLPKDQAFLYRPSYTFGVNAVTPDYPKK